MKLLHRRMLLFSSAVVFISVAPLVILYAIGYRGTLGSVDPLPVGVIIIESFPRRAEVMVNGEPRGRTPRAAPNLTPGQFDVVVEKAGYTPWRKTIAVEPGHATELRHIRLFPANPPRDVLGTGVAALGLAPNRELLAWATLDNTLSVTRAATGTTVSRYRLPAAVEDFIWSPLSDTILLRLKGRRYWLYEQARASPSLTLIKALHGARQVAWDPHVPNRLFVLTQGQALRAYDVADDASVPIALRVKTFALSDRHLYYLDETNHLTQRNLSGGRTRTIATPELPIKELLITPSGHVAILTETGELHVLNTGADTWQGVGDHVSEAQWSPDGALLAFISNGHALYVYNESDERPWLTKGEGYLAVSLSRPMSHLKWFAGGNHLLYQVADEIWITEIDTRGQSLAFQVDTTNRGDAASAVGHDGDALYYLKNVDEAPTLVATRLVLTQEDVAESPPP